MEKNKNAIIVVEGKTDTRKLETIFNDIKTIETNGSDLNEKTINLIKRASINNNIILFLDPDGPGEKIRKILQNELESFQQAFIKKTDIKDSKKIGIAEATDESIIKAFENLKYFNNKINTLSWSDYLSLNLNNKSKRKMITDKLKISESNHKQLFKRLNMMNMDINEIKKIMV